MEGRSPTAELPSSPATVPKMPSVLVFSFLGRMRYGATSYPHPIMKSKEKELKKSRLLAISKSAPQSLLEFIQEQCTTEPKPRHDNTRLFNVKPGCYFMHILHWYPRSSTPASEADDGLWHVYSWRERADARFAQDRNPAVDDLGPSYETLGKYLAHIKKDRDNGHISHLALGETPSTFFIRLSDSDGTWDYRHKLPDDCNMALQKAMSAGLPGNFPDGTPNPGPRVWKPSAVRGVTFGPGGGWILFRDSKHEPLTNETHFPQSLKDALKLGRDRKWKVNQAVLNPHHALEYVLAFDDGQVYCSFHWTFGEDFRLIAKEWCDSKDQELDFNFVPLYDHDYRFTPTPLPTEDEHGEAIVTSATPIPERMAQAAPYQSAGRAERPAARPYEAGEPSNNVDQRPRPMSYETFPTLPYQSMSVDYSQQQQYWAGGSLSPRDHAMERRYKDLLHENQLLENRVQIMELSSQLQGMKQERYQGLQQPANIGEAPLAPNGTRLNDASLRAQEYTQRARTENENARRQSDGSKKERSWLHFGRK